ncbi:preprotein translocase subunit SecA [Exiguobacterium sp. s163]|uniref:preprotein translocase subunit SecA n=1 Tax=Exiguobacterium sp. s163 TaxID=2751287 RepID=UPI001BEADD49|nr:preprotein translocase subunit SecA [Exiguobacterium sp. s163]
MGILKRLKESETKRFLKQAEKKVVKIESLSDEIRKLSNEEIQYKTTEFKNRLKNGETLDDLLVEAFAVCREASERILGMRHYPVQLVGGIALHQGTIAEMRTGEGKTLVATLAAYLNALTGEGVHVVTVNDYLAKRDHDIMAPLYHFLGLTTGVITGDDEAEERAKQYDADITYITNTELGFDFLRDNMVMSPEERVQRKLVYCIVDEVDSVLLDDARTPLIISGGGEEPTHYYKLVDMYVRTLKKKTDFEIDEETKQIWLTDAGIDKTERFFRLKNYTSDEGTSIRFHVEKALYAHQFMEVDRDYILRKGEVLIIDQGTGRVSEGRRFSNGLHQALEAKEGVKVQRENKTFATITYQNFFLLYTKISGMTGTAKTEELEFREIYGLPVHVIPTNKPVQREDHDDKLYVSAKAKYDAIVEDVLDCIRRGQPVLIGTSSIEKSELVSDLLKERNVEHVVLNAKNHAMEAEIIKNAGKRGTVTIATNMAGRGTDIKLGEGVREVGGLKIIGTERHENRRIDNQLRGRAGRQGDPGSSQFYLSFDDDLLRIFAPPSIRQRLKQFVTDESAQIENKLLLKTIQSSQKKLEGNHYDMRKETIKYDSINNQQRMKLYHERNLLLDGEVNVIDALKSATLDWVKRMFAIEFADWMIHRDDESYFHSTNRFVEVMAIQGVTIPKKEMESLEGQSPKVVEDWVISQVEPLFNMRAQSIQDEENVLRMQVLQAIDHAWTEHLETLNQIKENVRFASYKQANPVQEYNQETLVAFNQMSDTITTYMARIFLRLSVSEEAVQ